MKYLIKILALLLTLSCALTMTISASAIGINDSEVFLEQSVKGNSGTCTLVAATMMLRRRAILDGKEDWRSITEASVKPRAWIDGTGARGTYSYDGMTVVTKGLGKDTTAKEKTEKFISLLSLHPEGIVVYNHSKPHAVLLTDYDAESGIFYCADPAKNIGRIPLSNCTIPGKGQNEKIANINQIWYIASIRTVTNTKPKVENTITGNWIVIIPANYKLILYIDAISTTSSGKYVSPKSSPYQIFCTKRTTLSDGSVRYYALFNESNDPYWFTYGNGMSAKDTSNNSKTFTITFNANGGSVAPTSKTVTAGVTYGQLPTPVKSGSSFDGWYTAKSGGTKIVESTKVNLSSNQTLYARWLETRSTLTIPSAAYFNGTLKQGSRYSLQGTITSNYNIISVKGEIRNSEGNVVFSYTQRPNAKSFSLLNSKLDANMKFNELPPGKYHLSYTVEDASGRPEGKITGSSGFTIVGEEIEPSTLKITSTAYPTGTLRQGSRYSLKGTVTSNYNITSVKGEIIDSNGRTAFSYTQRPNATSFSILNSNLDANMKFNELSPGTYYLKYTAQDESGKSVDWYSDTFEIQGEQRKQLATVTFDPEGGSVNQRTKTVALGELIGTLPTPVREGYDFIGWATGRGSSMIVTSDNYWVEGDVTLYAHWRPKPIEEPPVREDPDVEVTKPEPEPEPEPVGHWDPWSEWGYIPVSGSETRQVETREVRTSDGYIEYRYGRYIDPTGKHNCWCATYLEGLFKGTAREQYSSWSRTRYSTSGTGWSCGSCRGNHRGVDHTGSDGRDWWAEYVLPNGHYYWEESRTVPAEYKTQYRYRDWIYG